MCSKHAHRLWHPVRAARNNRYAALLLFGWSFPQLCLSGPQRAVPKRPALRATAVAVKVTACIPVKSLCLLSVWESMPPHCTLLCMTYDLTSPISSHCWLTGTLASPSLTHMPTTMSHSCSSHHCAHCMCDWCAVHCHCDSRCVLAG